jgi:hypothetical protein
MEISYLPIAELKKLIWEDNPRRISTEEMNNLRSAIAKFGFLTPIVVNKSSNRIVGGHQRLQAAELEGLTELPVTYVDLDDSGEATLNIALNRISGNWDYQLLEEALDFIGDDPASFATGFSERELISLFAGAEDDSFLPNQESFDEFVNSMGQRVAKNSGEDDRLSGTESQPEDSDSATYRFNAPGIDLMLTKQEYIQVLTRIQSEVGFNALDGNKRFWEILQL